MNRILLAALLSTVLVPAAGAHEYIVKPGATVVAAGAKLGFSVSSSHVFMVSEELEDAEDVSVALLVDGKRQALPLTKRDATFTYEGEATAPSTGTFMLVGARAPQVWSLTPEGMKRGTPAQPTRRATRSSPRPSSTSARPTQGSAPSSATGWRSCPCPTRPPCARART